MVEIHSYKPPRVENVEQYRHNCVDLRHWANINDSLCNYLELIDEYEEANPGLDHITSDSLTIFDQTMRIDSNE